MVLRIIQISDVICTIKNYVLSRHETHHARIKSTISLYIFNVSLLSPCDGLQLHFSSASIQSCIMAHTFKPVRCKPKRCRLQTQSTFPPPQKKDALNTEINEPTSQTFAARTAHKYSDTLGLCPTNLLPCVLMFFFSKLRV